MFYESKLRSKVSPEIGNFALNWDSLPNKEVPILLHPTFNECKKDGLSFYNVDEINTTKSYVDSLLKDGINGKTVLQEDIGIVSPYKAQILRLKETFSKQQKIEIGTAEYFQGREKKIMIISAVKSGRKFPVGFLSNEKVAKNVCITTILLISFLYLFQRLNVMLTRAKCLLIVVCNPLNLQKDPQWREFIRFCLENNACIGNKIELMKKPSGNGDQQDIIRRVKETSGKDKKKPRKSIVRRAEQKTRCQVNGST